MRYCAALMGNTSGTVTGRRGGRGPLGLGHPLPSVALLGGPDATAVRGHAGPGLIPLSLDLPAPLDGTRVPWRHARRTDGAAGRLGQ